MKINPTYKRDRSAFSPKFESLTAAGANEIVSQIVKVWAQRGYVVSVWREEIPGMPGAWQVRSKLRGGMPTKSSFAMVG